MVDVLVKGLSRGAIATRKLKGVNRDKGHEVYTGSSPCGEGKSLQSSFEWECWKYALEAIIKLLFISSYHDKCLLFMLELY